MLQPRFLLKEQSRPYYLNLAWLSLVWGLILISLYILFEAYTDPSWRNSASAPLRETAILFIEVPWEFWGILFGLALTLAVIHFWVLRLLRSEHRVKIGWREAVLLGGLACVSTAGGIHSYHHLQLRNEWVRAIWQSGLENELMLMTDRGQYREVVVKMERAMSEFRHAKKMLGDDFHYRKSGPFGMSYLLSTCNLAWEHTDRHMPFGVGIFLQQPEDWSRSTNDFRTIKWQSMAQEMSSSSDPVLRCFGYWMLEDEEAFLRIAYEEAQKGNEACYGLALFAAVRIDSDHMRAFHVTSPIWTKVELLHRSLSYQIFLIGAKVLKSGQSLGEHEGEYRKALLAYHKEFDKELYPYPPPLFYEILTQLGYDKERESLEELVRKKTPKP